MSDYTHGQKVTIHDMKLVVVADDKNQNSCNSCALQSTNCMGVHCTKIPSNPVGWVFLHEDDYVVQRLKGLV